MPVAHVNPGEDLNPDPGSETRNREAGAYGAKQDVVDALEAAIELVGGVVTGEVTQDDSGTGLLASYKQQFREALADMNRLAEISKE